MAEAADREKEHREKVAEAGSWITDDFLRDLLARNEKSDRIKVVEKNVTAAVGFGNNYLSILHRVKVKFCENGSGEKEKNLIIKQFPTTKLTQKMLNEMGFFEKEIMIYSEILPKMQEISKRHTDDPFIAPVSYPVEMENVLIMEDLKVQGYKIMDRTEQLPFEYCVLALKALARLQVLSLALQKERPGLCDKVTTEFYAEKSREFMGVFMEQIFPMMSKQLAQYPELEKYSEVTEKFGPKAFDVVKTNFEKASKNFVQVFSHGDMWTTNVMFKEDENGRPVHAKLVDFQVCRMSSPAIDLLHLTYTSTQPRVLAEKWPDLIKEYYESFQENLQLFGIKETYFTLEELHAEIRRVSPYGFMLINVMLPSFLTATEDVIDMDSIDEDSMEIPDDGDYLKKLFRKEKTRNAFKAALDHCDRFGFLKEVEKTMSII